MSERSPASPDAAARRALAQHRMFATGLLGAMAALTLATFALPASYATSMLQAAAKAGFVGGIADWFAVTALFRHPLGLPIPHTAIIPRQKARLGRALGRFVAEHVFTQAELSRMLARIDLPGILSRFLSDPQATRPAAEAMAATLPKLLASVEDGRARRMLGRIVPRMLGGAGAGRVVGQALRKLAEGGRHQEVFTFILIQLRGVMKEKEGSLRSVIEERVREQGGRLVGWAVGAQVARRVLSQLNAELDKMTGDESDLREAFGEWMGREIDRIETDPVRAAEIGAALRRVLAHPSLQGWIWDVWSRLRLTLEQDAGNPSGRTVALIESALANFGALLATDPGAQVRLQAAAEAIVIRVLPAAQVQLADFIGDVVANWDARTITDRLELRVGKDLQYVRINGTLVGFLVGGLVYALLRATFGAVSF